MMNSNKSTARIVGVLFIIATAAPIVTAIFIGFLGGAISGETDLNYLSRISADEIQLLLGMIIELIWALSVIGIPIMLYPILKRHSETLALVFFGLRFVEALCVIIGSIALLMLLSLSGEYLSAGSEDSTLYKTLGSVLLAGRYWTFLIGSGVFWSLSPLILNYSLYRTELVPRWLSVWGFAGALISLVVYLLKFFSFNQLDMLFMPIALQEMVFALCLIIKGFNPSSGEQTGVPK